VEEGVRPIMAALSASITEPLLRPYHYPSAQGQLAEWAQDQYVGSAPRQPASVEVDAMVTGQEIRTAASADPYPPSIHAPLLTTADYSPEGFSVTQQPFQESQLKTVGSTQVLDEVEIRELLIDHVGHRCCWGSRPARKWNIHAVEDCNAYVGTLETFIEERDVIVEIEPYPGGPIDGKESGPEPGPWELDMKSEFPLLFVSRKETRLKVPHSEAVQKCSGCAGRGELPCLTCNKNNNREPGFYTSQTMILCSVCHGRGLIAHTDGSDSICGNCKGEGRLPCSVCQSRGLVKCEKCRGDGSLLTRNIATVRWRTLMTRKISACSSAASVPDEVFHRAKGVQLCNIQAYQCKPTNFSDSFVLNKFSSDIIADRAPVPPTARVICERHQITVVPVTRVIMTRRDRSFTFYIIGLSREVYVKDYPLQWCWGLCSCVDWLSH